jgi:Flp pilus assembly protein CpaB
LKRSNRLVLLVGVFLAVVAFVGIVVLAGGGTSNTPVVPTTGNVVEAAVDIPLSAKVKLTDVKVVNLPLTAINAGAFSDPSQVVGQIARIPVSAGGQITASTFLGTQGTTLHPVVPAGLRAISVQVDQVTGVGTVIQTGDYVDLVAGLTGDKFPVVTVNPTDNVITVVTGVSATSAKVLLQGLQVIGTLLPPASATPAATGDGSTPSQPGTALNGQQEIVILAVTAQQAEVIKYAQIDATVSLVLRSPDDFNDPTTGQAITPIPVDTTGITLKALVDTYGVLPPEVIETVTPKSK